MKSHLFKAFLAPTLYDVFTLYYILFIFVIFKIVISRVPVDTSHDTKWKSFTDFSLLANLVPRPFFLLPNLKHKALGFRLGHCVEVISQSVFLRPHRRPKLTNRGIDQIWLVYVIVSSRTWPPKGAVLCNLSALKGILWILK